MNAKQPKKLGNVLKITPPDKEMTDQETIAWSLVHLPVLAAETSRLYLREPFKDCLHEHIAELTKQIAAVNEGDMSNVEGLLVQQAHSLNIIFNRMAQYAQVQETLPNIEGFLKLALRAQSQCARTLEVLSAVKTPPHVSFVRQQNVGFNQQVNTGTQASPPVAGSPAINHPQWEQTDGHYLDPGTAKTAVGIDPPMATVGTSHRPEDAGGKSEGSAQRF